MVSFSEKCWEINATFSSGFEFYSLEYLFSYDIIVILVECEGTCRRENIDSWVQNDALSLITLLLLYGTMLY